MKRKEEYVKLPLTILQQKKEFIKVYVTSIQ